MKAFAETDNATILRLLTKHLPAWHAEMVAQIRTARATAFGDPFVVLQMRDAKTGPGLLAYFEGYSGGDRQNGWLLITTELANEDERSEAIGYLKGIINKLDLEPSTPTHSNVLN